MNKRDFLAAAAAAGAAALPGSASASARPVRGPVLLTVSGAIERVNRGPLDPALDQMMQKHGVKFDKAHAFDFTMLTLLPPATIRPTIEYDNRQHVLAGPALADVLKAAGARPDGNVLLRAIDGYTASLPPADIRKYGFIVATHMDGKPLPLGGLGPLWAVYHADRFPDMAAKTVKERFVSCPWGLYHIEVRPA